MTEIIRRNLDDQTQLTAAERVGQAAFSDPRQREDVIDCLEAALTIWPDGTIGRSAYTNETVASSVQKAVQRRYQDAAEKLASGE